jgi:CBS domain-containing protein
LLSADIEESSLEVLDEGRIPELQALMVHNGTIYRWNRPCYGVSKGVPHLRIENRVLPSGPSIPDMVANAALWYGLMLGMPPEYENLAEIMDFDDARDNFTMAARSGLQTRFKWMNDKVLSAPELIIDHLIPIAQKGLQKYGLPEKEIDKNLEIIKKRVSSGKTGSQWALDSFAKLKKVGSREEALLAITVGMAKRQEKNIPVHEWTLAELDEAGDWTNTLSRVEQIMTVDLVTVREHDLIDLVEKLMDWWGIHHIPVEDSRGKLIGLVTSSIMDRFNATVNREASGQMAIRHIMKPVPYTCSPDTPTADAINMMKEKKVGALMVVNEGKLVGIITKEDIKNIADRLPKELIGD